MAQVDLHGATVGDVTVTNATICNAVITGRLTARGDSSIRDCTIAGRIRR